MCYIQLTRVSQGGTRVSEYRSRACASLIPANEGCKLELDEYRMMNMKKKVSPRFLSKNNPNFYKNIFLYLAVGFLMLWVLSQIKIEPQKSTPVIPFSQVVADIEAKKIQSVVVDNDTLQLQYKDGAAVATSYKESGQSLMTAFKDAGLDNPTQLVEITFKNQDGTIFWSGLLGNLLPIVIMVVFFIILIRQAQKSSGSILSFGRSGAKMFMRDQSRTTFANVAGVDEAKQELQEVVDFLKNPDKYRKLGARIPKGVLLVGPAGTGKTLLARAVAGEANVPFFSMAGSEFMEMLVGVGASRVRDLFQNAKKASPAIIFIDEVELIGRHRAMNVFSSHGEQEQTLNQILVEMDGFEPSVSVIVLAATNRPDLLDPALTRPGRFDRRVVLELPDLVGRKEIFKIHMNGKPMASNLNLDKIAKRTVGFSGADIENMLNESAILAARNGASEISNSDLEEAATKVKLGPARQRIQSDEDKKITAFHEAGHAIVASSLTHMDPVHRVSIISRGIALGYTEINPEMDRSHQTKTRLLEQITTLLGGRAAEELIFNEMTVGAGSDLETASRLARKMVSDFGMSGLGPLSFPKGDASEGLMGGFQTEGSSYSEEMMARIDNEVKKIIDDSFKKAQEILLAKRVKLDLVGEELIKKETIDGDEFLELIAESPAGEIQEL